MFIHRTCQVPSDVYDRFWGALLAQTPSEVRPELANDSCMLLGLTAILTLSTSQTSHPYFKGYGILSLLQCLSTFLKPRSHAFELQTSKVAAGLGRLHMHTIAHSMPPGHSKVLNRNWLRVPEAPLALPKVRSVFRQIEVFKTNLDRIQSDMDKIQSQS